MAIVMIGMSFSGSPFTHMSSYILPFYCFFSYIPVIHYRQHCKVHQLSSSTKTSASYLLFSSWSHLLPSLFSSCPITHYSCSVVQKYRHYHLFFSLNAVDNTYPSSMSHSASCLHQIQLHPHIIVAIRS